MPSPPLNALEMILDSSVSMQALTASGKTKFETVREALITLLRDVINPTKNVADLINISYFVECSINLINPDYVFETLDTIEANAGTPLALALNRSAGFLNALQGNYRRIIIIFSDGEETCHGNIKKTIKHINTSSKKLGNTIQIYVLKIGEVSNQATKELRYIAKKTNGKVYTIDIADNMDEIYADLKRDFTTIIDDGSHQKIRMWNIFKKLLRLLAYLLIVFFTLLILAKFPSCHFNFGTFNTPHAVDLKSKEKEESNIQKKNIDGINTYTLLTKKNEFIKAIAYRHKNSKVIVLQNLFPSGKSDVTHNSFLNHVLKNEVTQNKQIKGIDIIGHTDLEATSQRNFDSTDYCKKHDINPHSNECLGVTRTLKVSDVIEQGEYKNSANKINLMYRHDFFMAEANGMLDGTLIRSMGIKSEINKIKKELSIPESYNIFRIRNNKDVQYLIQQNIKKVKKGNYKERFLPFRSVVVIIHYE